MGSAERSREYRQRKVGLVIGYGDGDIPERNVLDWLCEPIPGNPIRCWWSFDRLMIEVCWEMPAELIVRLYGVEPVEYQGVTLRYCPGRWLEVRKNGNYARHNMIAGYFTGGLADASVRLLGSAETAATGRVVTLLAQAVRDSLARIPLRGHVLAGRSMAGPGSVANRVLSLAAAYPINRVQEEWSGEVSKAVIRAQYGGRIETYGAGTLGGPIYRYDLHSAYAWALSRSPRLGTGWEPVTGYKIGRPLALYRVRWDWRNHQRESLPFGPLPWRSHTGRIVYRAEGEGWYWQPEIAEAWRCFPGLTILEGWVCDGPRTQPFRRVCETLYAARRKLAETDGIGADVLKLTLAALWGKLAQEQGQARYACPALAGWVTAKIRGELLRAMRQDPGAILAVMTDGLLTTRPLRLWEGVAMGSWSCERYESVTIVGPGQYRLTAADGTITEALRGIGPDGPSLSELAYEVSAHGIAHLSQPVRVTPILWAISPDAFPRTRDKWGSLDLRVSPYRADKRRWDTVTDRWLLSREWPDLLEEWMPNAMVAGPKGIPPAMGYPPGVFQLEGVYSAMLTAMRESGL